MTVLNFYLSVWARKERDPMHYVVISLFLLLFLMIIRLHRRVRALEEMVWELPKMFQQLGK